MVPRGRVDLGPLITSQTFDVDESDKAKLVFDRGHPGYLLRLGIASYMFHEPEHLWIFHTWAHTGLG